MLPEEKPVYDKLLTVRSEYIANVIEFTDLNGLIYSVNEYISGTTLEEYVEQKHGLSDEEIRLIALDICRGLSLIHSLGVVHRDITPNNIIIEKSGRTRIIDFGISRLSDENKSKDTQILGTVGYAAPEQFGFSQTTSKADIYAVGALINYMAEGTLPNERLTEGAFRTIVLKCTQMDTEKRYRSIDDAAAAIDKKAKRSLFIKRIPGFGGSKLMKAIASFYYISVLFSAGTFLLVPGKRIMVPAFLLMFIAPLLIICDTSGKISSFCKKHNLSRAISVFIKIILVYIVFMISTIFIIADSI